MSPNTAKGYHKMFYVPSMSYVRYDRVPSSCDKYLSVLTCLTHTKTSYTELTQILIIQICNSHLKLFTNWEFAILHQHLQHLHSRTKSEHSTPNILNVWHTHTHTQAGKIQNQEYVPLIWTVREAQSMFQHWISAHFWERCHNTAHTLPMLLKNHLS